MQDKVLNVLYLLAAVVIVGAGLYLLLNKAAPIVAVRPEQAQRPAMASPAPPAYEQPSAAPSLGPPTIYRCDRGGSVVYSDTPCEGGRVVDVRITQGFEAERYRPRVSERSQAPVAATPRAPAVAQANGLVEEALCAQINSAIESVDAAARAGGSIQRMEELKERRRKLVEQRQEHRC